MKNIFFTLIFLLAFCINNKITGQTASTITGEITGEKNPYVAESYCTYTIKLPAPLINDIKVVVSPTQDNVALFTDDSNKKWGMTNKSVILKAGSNNFTFDVLWINEANNVSLKALNSIAIGGLYVEAKIENITVKTKNTSISGPSSIIVGQTVKFSTDRIQNVKDAEYNPKWEYDKNLFELVDELSSSNKYILNLKAKQAANSTNVNIKVEAYIYGVGKYINRKGTTSTSIILPYEMTRNKDIVCYGDEIEFEIKGIEKTPGASVNWFFYNSFSLISGQGTPKVKCQALNVNDYGGVRAEITYQGLVHTMTSSNVWIGAPKVKYSEKEYNMEEREPLTIQAGEFLGKYSPNTCTWELLSGKCEFVNQSGTSLTIKSTATAKEKDIIKIKASVSNECGTISVIHTINVPPLKGTSFDNPIHIDPIDIKKWCSYSDSRDNRLYGSKIYYSFNIKHHSILNISGSGNVYLFDSDKNLIKSGNQENSIEFVVEDPIKKGQYFIVNEGEDYNGEIGIGLYYEMSGLGPSHHAFIGSFSEAFSFSETRDTRESGYWDYYNPNFYMYYPVSKGHEVYYRFELEKEMEIVIHNAGPYGQPVATWIHLEKQEPFSHISQPLWSEFGYYNELIYQEDPTIPIDVKEGLQPCRAYYKTVLPPGIYNVITEGAKVSNTGEWNGPIQVTIEGKPTLSKKNIVQSIENSSPIITSIVYPNPVIDIINLEIKDYTNEGLSYKLIRLDNGQIVKKGRIENNFFKIDVSSNLSGIYLLQIIKSETIINSHKIIKR